MDARFYGQCTAINFARGLRVSTEQHSTLDLNDATWCDSSGLVAVATFAQSLKESGREVVVVAPANYNVANYMARMRLGQVLDALDVEHDIPEVFENDVESLIELREFDGAPGANDLASMAHDHIFDSDPEGAAMLLRGLGETAENVHEHSGRVSGFAAAQRYRDGRLNFCVGDSGQGMLGSLRPFGARTDEQAVQLALRRGGTGSGDIGRGNGLPNVMEQACASGGSLTVVTGRAAVTTRSLALNRSTLACDLPFPGTLIYGVLTR